MKNIVAILVALVLAFSMVATAEQYVLAGYITAIDTQTAEIEVTTPEGEVWAFYGDVEYWAIDEVCIMIVSDGFTPDDVTDDVIVIAGHYQGE